MGKADAGFAVANGLARAVCALARVRIKSSQAAPIELVSPSTAAEVVGRAKPPLLFRID